MVTQIKADNRPLYTRAVVALRALIDDGTYQPGQKLPPEPDLARELGISRTTLRVAMAQLEREGLVVRRQGVGTFVTQGTWPSLRGGLQFLEPLQRLAQAAGLDTATSERTVQAIPATAEWARILGVEEGARLNRVKYTVAIEGLPVASIDTLISDEIVSTRELLDSRGSLLEYLLDHSEVSPSYTQSQVFAVCADGSLAETLKVEPGIALLKLVETYFTRTGDPVALSYNHFVTERFNFQIGRIVRGP